MSSATISYGSQSVARTLDALFVENARLATLLTPGGYLIDEFALLVSDSNQLEQLDTILCLAFGWERFNVANDNVKTAPIRSAYSVEYHFYRHPDRDYRLEIMRLTSGISPLHAAIPLPLARQVCTPVHASFKTTNEEQYAYARNYIEGLGYSEAQRCDSNYGRFSYFVKEGMFVDRVPYLKPRVNLRDDNETT